MTPLRPTRRHRRSLPVLRYLVMLATLLSLMLTPLGNTLATPVQDGNQAQLAQDDADVPQQKSPNDPPQDDKPTEAPIETKEPPLETKPTEIPPAEPVQTEPVETKEPSPSEPAPTEQPSTKPAPSEPAPSEPPGSDRPGIQFTGTLIVIKGLCDDPAYPAHDAASLADLLANCTPHSTDATFTYTYSDTGDTLTQATSGSTTSFDVQPGGFSLREHLPPNYLTPVVGCESAMIGDSIVFVPGNGSTINFHIDRGDTFTCYWFNIPIPPTTITVIKGLCGTPGFDPYTASSDELVANCTQSSGDATFTYQQTHTGGPDELTLTQTTTGSSTTFVVPPGGYAIQESIPAGFGEPVVSCHLDQFNVDILPGVIAGAIVGHIDLGHTRTCHWYNVAAPSLPEPGSLTVIKYTCGPSTWWSPPLCPIHRKGQDFDLLQWIDGGWVSFGIGTTDRSGHYTWTDLPPGKYALDEIGRDWCRITSGNMTSGDRAITVEPGQETIVHVYNCATTKPTTPPVRVVNLLSLLLRDIWNPAP